MSYKIRLIFLCLMIALSVVSALAVQKLARSIDQIWSEKPIKVKVVKIFEASSSGDATGRLKAKVKILPNDSEFDMDALPGLKVDGIISVIPLSDSAAPLEDGHISIYFWMDSVSLAAGLLCVDLALLLMFISKLGSKIFYVGALSLWISSWFWCCFAGVTILTALDLGFPTSMLPPLLPAMFFFGVGVYWDPNRIYKLVMESPPRKSNS